jgi:predicted dehydrogenase
MATREYQELLANPEVEVVFVGTRHDLHEQLIQEAATAGKDVFVEKPMSKTWGETRRIVETVREAGVRLMVGYNRRFAPAMCRGRELFQTRHHGKPAMVTYRIVDDARLWPSWPMDPAIGGGKVLSEGCHIYDLLCWFLDDEPEWVQCAGRREDDNMIQMAFRNGSVATIVSGGCGSAAYPKERMEVFCDSSSMVIDMFLALETSGYGDVEDEQFDYAFDPAPELVGSTPLEGFRLKVESWRRHGITAEDLERKAYYGSFPEVNKGHVDELEAFARAIRAGVRSPCDEVAGARATAIALKAIASLEDGNRPQPLQRDEYLP